jgi:hypothetical protein
MNPMTIEATIQIGYDCGLTWLEEAYANIISHYDCFFEIEYFQEQKAAYNKLFIDKGYVDSIKCSIKPLLITDVAKDLGYELQELAIPEPTPGETDDYSNFTPIFDEVTK